MTTFLEMFLYLRINVVIWLYPKNAPIIAKIRNSLIKPLKMKRMNWSLTTESVNLTAEISKLPRSTTKEVVNSFWNQRDHEEKVRNGQIHHQHVGRRPQRLVAAEDFQDEDISTGGTGAYSPITGARNRLSICFNLTSIARFVLTHDQIEHSKKVSVNGMNGLLGLPVRMQERFDVIGSKVENGVVIRHRPRVEMVFLRQCQGDVVMFAIVS